LSNHLVIGISFKTKTHTSDEYTRLYEALIASWNFKLSDKDKSGFYFKV